MKKRSPKIYKAPGDPKARCQQCMTKRSAGKPLIIFEPCIDPSNGQRITIAICDVCIERAEFVDAMEPPRKTEK